jgi:phosphoglycolate phosphatase-like HAD superfamily hydrolase
LSAFARVLTLGALLVLGAPAHAQSDPLPSWNDGAAKQAIVQFVKTTTTQGSPKFVPVPERIATFDQDGTLWVEHPMYAQVMYCLDRVPALVKAKPELANVEPFKTVMSGNREAMAKLSEADLIKIAAATLTGMPVDAFQAAVKTWLATARDPRWKKPYTELTYQPMQEVLSYLRANGYKTYIVTGGGQDFVRVYAEATYGVPPEQVVGSAGGTTYGYDKNGRPFLTKAPKLLLNDNNAGKPEGIHLMIGRRPHAAFGNSPGDQQMLEYTKAGDGARLSMLVLHDDAKREYVYGPAQGLPATKVGAFTQALYDQAQKQGWTVISMKNDWKTVFPAEQPAVTAIDILLEPDATMLKHAAANNARLLKVYPQGFALDAAHRPHITMLQCFVRTADLDKVYAVEEKVLAAAKVNAMKLDAFKYYYAPTGATGVAGIVAKPTPELLKLQADIIAAAKPFMVQTGPIGAFTAPHDNPAIDAAIIEYVSTFVPKMSGDHFNPHVSSGVAPKAYLDTMLAEPFESFTFSPAGAAVYQLGPFGTAAKQLKEWDLKQ